MSRESPELTIRSDGNLNRSIAPSAPDLTRLVDDAPAAGDGGGGPASPNVPRSRPPRGGLAPWQAKRVATYVREHIGATLRASELAALVRLSNSHFNRAFKVSFQQTPTAYVMRQRMRHAQEMMLTTCHPLSYVALQCGLCDQAHFSRMFRRLVGESPRLWRRQFASDSNQSLTPAEGSIRIRTMPRRSSVEAQLPKQNGRQNDCRHPFILLA
jgi:AraC-like DNA-binding protein